MSEKKPDIVRCPYSARCGGCGYMGANYEDTLKKKQDEVVKLLKGFGHVNTIVGADNPYNYRNKVHAVLSGGRRGEIYAGTYEAGTHKVVDVKSCAIDDVILNLAGALAGYLAARLHLRRKRLAVK